MTAKNLKSIFLPGARHLPLVSILSMLCTLLYGLMLTCCAKTTNGPESLRPAPPRRPLVIAHRGGAALWPENTLYAFTRARDLGVDVLEMDVQVTADGVLIVLHDSTLDRTTDGTGAANALSLAELKKLDAAFRFTTDGGRTFPLSGRGIVVPTLQEVFKALPHMRFNIEPKQAEPSIVRPLCKMIRESDMTKQVTVGSFNQQVLQEFRKECPEVSTAASPAEVSAFLAMKNGEPASSARAFAAQALQVPEQLGGRRLLTREFIEAAHARQLQVHAWTINDEESMKRLIALDIDGIMTDYPDRLIGLLKGR